MTLCDMGRACPLSFTDFPQPSLNERMVWAGANLIMLPQYGLYCSVGP